MPTSQVNTYTSGSVARTFVKTAIPIIFLTSLNGLLTVIDAIFLGAFVGPDAITAVTLVFPISMLLVALASMVSTGMASVLARLLGAGHLADARQIFAGAHGISIAVSILLIAIFAAIGWPLLSLAAAGSPAIAGMGYNFLAISIFTSPVMFLLSIHSDALRTEGRIGFMAIAGSLVTLSNMVFNYAFIVWFGLGVAGSATGTVLAQALALLSIVVYRLSGRAQLGLPFRDLAYWHAGWASVLGLGAPRSLTFIGISLSAAATIISLGLVGTGHFDSSVAAYGIITRIMAFAFFPLLGMSLALQALVGNNAGAGLWQRSNDSLKLSLLLSLAYSGLLEISLITFRHSLGALFTADPDVLAEIDRIIPILLLFYFSFGPMMMIASYFQSLGDVRRSAILALSRTYLFALPLIFALPMFFGENGVWLASPIADVMLLLATALVLRSLAADRAWGLFEIA